MKLVSVIIPCFNQGKFLADCLDSVVSQREVNLDIIVVDDGSTDCTADVARHAQESDCRIRYFFKINGGLSSARNLGLLHAKGDYIKFVDSDDVLAPGKLGVLADYLGEHPDCDIAYGESSYFDDGSFGDFRSSFLSGSDRERWIGGLWHDPRPMLEKILRRNMMPVCSPLMRRGVIAKVGLFDMTLKAMEDWDFWIRTVLSGCSFHYSADFGVVAYIRVHPSSLTVNSGGMAFGEYMMRRSIHPRLGAKRFRLVNLVFLLDLVRRLNSVDISQKYDELKRLSMSQAERNLVGLNAFGNCFMGGVVSRALRGMLPWRIRNMLATHGVHT